MAKIVISIEDDGDEVDVRFHFDPPIDEIKPGEETKAQQIVSELIVFMTANFNGEAAPEESGE